MIDDCSPEFIAELKRCQEEMRQHAEEWPPGTCAHPQPKVIGRMKWCPDCWEALFDD